MNVLAVVPAYKESDTIGDTIKSLLSIPSIGRVVVVDDGSGDDTPRWAAASGATVVVNNPNMGKGGSLSRVLEDLEFDMLLLVDGDLGEFASEASALIEPVLDNEADLAIAVFPKALRKGGFGLVKGLGRSGIKSLTGFESRSPLSGQRAMTRELYDKVAPLDGGFGMEVGMTIDALREGFRVIEVETTMSHKETGRDLQGFIHRGKQFIHVFAAVARRVLKKEGKE
ncbi:MAG: glycosyltransferase family 2 protein [Actinobacteria bacterium]|nr:glycosyltransferase family 2 protein [Actinomycetota bacterium]